MVFEADVEELAAEEEEEVVWSCAGVVVADVFGAAEFELDFDAILPPTPPPTAPAITMIATTTAIQNVFAGRPQIRLRSGEESAFAGMKAVETASFWLCISDW